MTQQRMTILDKIGNTPLVSISRLSPRKDVEILAKLEFFNPGGSVKDRPALAMIQEGEKSGELTRDKIILEATSGNTGIGLALVAAVKSYRLRLVMSEAVSEERKQILRAMGAELTFTPAHLGTDGAIEHAYNIIRDEPEKYWLADQFNNDANWKAHFDGTALEIWEQTEGRLDVVVSAMGTTGTLMGLSRRLKKLNPEVRIVGVEPYLGHKIQGLKNMKESYRPGIFKKEIADRIINIDDEDAYQTARLLAKKEGIFVGMSSGAAMAVALQLAEEMTDGRIVVIFPDGGERYLSTPLFVDRKKSGLLLYNTFSRKKEEFVPIEENRVSMYTCGPTLCQLIHIGQCRRFVFADLVKRYMTSKGYQVTHVVNVTDLDDRTIDAADEAGISLETLTGKFFQKFLDDLKTLNIEPASAFPKASEHVDDMIGLAQKLIEKGYAYEKLKSVYYDISRFKDYGKLSRIDLDKIRVGKTVDLEQYEKENPRDFTLLKRSTLKELKKGIYFQTPWGNSRPSWHMECPAMALKLLGETYDIHTSGVDLIFPHHENAIAISQAVTGKPPARYWLHNELVLVNGKKPERGPAANFKTIRDLLNKGYTGREIRYWLMSSHYRKPMSFSWAKLDTAKKTLSNLDKFTKKLHSCPSGPPHPDMDQLIYDARHQFVEAMEDDFNISPALAALFQFTHQVNAVMDREGLSASDREKVLAAMERVNGVLGFLDLEPPSGDAEVDALVEKRETARKARDWETADRLRRELVEMGVELIDTKKGPVWRKLK
ncbi:MAG: cysteine--tRNA ligase [Deltaproteobacteria bacterium]|nr:cysteine--tRNA ligase [Deltaproteobacteria bacterium]